MVPLKPKVGIAYRPPNAYCKVVGRPRQCPRAHTPPSSSATAAMCARKVHSLLMQQPMPSSPEQLPEGCVVQKHDAQRCDNNLFEVTQLNCS